MATIWLDRYSIPRRADAGLHTLLNSLAGRELLIEDLLAEINAQSDPDINQSILLRFIADAREAGLIPKGTYMDGGPVIVPVQRLVAPGGVTDDVEHDAVFFTTPDSGEYDVVVCLNGLPVIEERRNLAANRTFLKSQIGCQPGDVVQIGLVSNEGTAGWWGRVTVT